MIVKTDLRWYYVTAAVAFVLGILLTCLIWRITEPRQQDGFHLKIETKRPDK